jgi:hypothetical protein
MAVDREYHQALRCLRQIMSSVLPEELQPLACLHHYLVASPADLVP